MPYLNSLATSPNSPPSDRLVSSELCYQRFAGKQLAVIGQGLVGCPIAGQRCGQAVADPAGALTCHQPRTDTSSVPVKALALSDEFIGTMWRTRLLPGCRFSTIVAKADSATWAFAEFSSKWRRRFSHLRGGSWNCTVVQF
jgi:hypothetical protein